MIVRNVFLSLLLSLALTLVVTVLYVFYPIISLLAGSLFRRFFSSEAHTEGIAVVAGGGSAVLWVAALIAFSLFVMFFVLLQRRSHR